MKHFISFSLLRILILASSGLTAQDEAKTLFCNETSVNAKNLGFFVKANYGISQMDESNAHVFNASGGLTVNDQFSIGGYYSKSIAQINPKSETISNVYMDYWSVGGLLEYTLFPKNLIHFTFPLYIGYGEVEMDNEIGNAGLGEANFFQFEPMALLEINLHKNVRFDVGTGYRFVSKMDYRNFNQSDISGFTGYIGFKFGLFK